MKLLWVIACFITAMHQLEFALEASSVWLQVVAGISVVGYLWAAYLAAKADVPWLSSPRA